MNNHRKQSEPVAEQIAALTSADLSLVSGLRAAAEETTSPTLAAALDRTADRLASGASLDDALAAARAPTHVRKLLLAAQRSGEMGRVLADYNDARGRLAGVEREMWLAVAYPLLLIVLAVTLLFVQANIASPGLEAVYDEFDVAPDQRFNMLKAFASFGIPELFGMLALLATFLVAIRLAAGAELTSHLVKGVPLLGRLRQHMAAAAFLRVVELLVARRVPLPEAVTLAGESIDDHELAIASKRMAQYTASGQAFSTCLEASRAVPDNIVPLVAWGEQHNALPAGLEVAAELCEAQAHAQARLVQRIMPLVALLVCLIAFVVLIGSVITPIIRAIDLFGSF